MVQDQRRDSYSLLVLVHREDEPEVLRAIQLLVAFVGRSEVEELQL
jgi:hypothetical protein